MNVFVAVDDNYGMMFNSRRQSQDTKLREYIFDVCADNVLWVNTYTAKQFKECNTANLIVDDNFLDKADFCFVENLSLLPHLNKISCIYLCKWNRKYPSDFKFDIDLSADWVLCSTTDIIGNSHEKITIEEWRKK